MSCVIQLFRGSRDLPPPIAATVRAWRARPRVPEATALAATRFVVLDVETTGLNPRRDRLLSIGAVPVERLRLVPGGTFTVLLQNEAPSTRENIVVHGLTPARQAAGEPRAQALGRFLEFLGKAPCVAFHADFDRAVLERALHEELGVRLPNPWLDLAALAPALVPQARLAQATLDDWLAHFRIPVHARHDAVHDAYAAAELLLLLLARARARGLSTLAQLRAEEHAHTSRHRR